MPMPYEKQPDSGVGIGHTHWYDCTPLLMAGVAIMPPGQLGFTRHALEPAGSLLLAWTA